MLLFEVDVCPINLNTCCISADEPTTISIANDMETSKTVNIMSLNGDTVANVRIGNTDTVGKIKLGLSQELSMAMNEFSIVVGTEVAHDHSMPSTRMTMVRHNKVYEWQWCATTMVRNGHGAFFFPEWYKLEHDSASFPSTKSDLIKWLTCQEIESRDLTAQVLMDVFQHGVWIQRKKNLRSTWINWLLFTMSIVP